MPTAFVHVTAANTVNEVLGRYPSTAPVFHLLGLDARCEGNLPLRDAAVRGRTDLGMLLSMLEASACASLAASGGR